MGWNQISENILCNSEYYNKIYNDSLYHDIRDSHLANLENIIQMNIQLFSDYTNINIENTTPVINVGDEQKRRNLEIFINTTQISSGIFINVTYSYIYDTTIETGRKLGRIYIESSGRRCGVLDYNGDTGNITLRTIPQNIFHFSFHSITSNIRRPQKKRWCISFEN